jgi:hypothetical protein
MMLNAGMHGCEELKGSGRCGGLLVLHQVAVVNDAIVHCPLSTVRYWPSDSVLRPGRSSPSQATHFSHLDGVFCLPLA